jgi:hypothetical protein
MKPSSSTCKDGQVNLERGGNYSTPAGCEVATDGTCPPEHDCDPTLDKHQVGFSCH